MMIYPIILRFRFEALSNTYKTLHHILHITCYRKRNRKSDLLKMRIYFKLKIIDGQDNIFRYSLHRYICIFVTPYTHHITRDPQCLVNLNMKTCVWCKIIRKLIIDGILHTYVRI